MPSPGIIEERPVASDLATAAPVSGRDTTGSASMPPFGKPPSGKPQLGKPQYDQLAQTHEYSPLLGPNGSSLRDRVALIEADEDERADESLAEWAQRLLTVCGILWAGFLTFFVRNLLAEPIVGPMRWLWAYMFALLGLSSALLASWKWGPDLGHSARQQGPRLTCRRLLLVELLLFGGTSLYFAASIHLAAAGTRTSNWVVFNIMSSVTWSCVLAFTYTMIAADARPRSSCR